jgi:hypothetical protein
MDQIKELLEILKSTPELALWGLGIWCLYILAKLASIVFALKSVLQLGINRLYDYKTQAFNVKSEESVRVERDSLIKEREILIKDKSDFSAQKDNLLRLKELAKRFDKNSITSDVFIEDFQLLIDTMKKSNSPYIHKGDIQKAIEKLKN